MKESFNEISHAVTFIDHSVTSLRGDYSVDPARNLAHASFSLAAAGREISACFGPGELTQWKAVNLGWIYEDEEEDGVQEVGLPRVIESRGLRQAPKKPHAAIF